MTNLVRTPGDATSAIENRFQRHQENPFLVLGLSPDATAAEIERQGQKWSSMLAAGIAEAAHYLTPFGPGERSADLVRAAVAELADPARRLVHEWWARGFGAAAGTARERGR
jgi:hypothetical protein